MNEREIIILTKSKKYGGYCVAGIDRYTGEWIRLIINNNRPIFDNDIKYENGNYVDVLDIIRVNLIENKSNYYQPENWTYDNNNIKYIGKSNINEILNIHHPENNNFLFYNDKNYVSPNEIVKIPPYEKHSLTLIRPNGFKIYVDEYGKPRCNFEYSGIRYNGMPITDFKIRNYVRNIENYKNFKFSKLNCVVVVSLGSLYKLYHYKLVAQVFCIDYSTDDNSYIVNEDVDLLVNKIAELNEHIKKINYVYELDNAVSLLSVVKPLLNNLKTTERILKKYILENVDSDVFSINDRQILIKKYKQKRLDTKNVKVFLEELGKLEEFIKEVEYTYVKIEELKK